MPGEDRNSPRATLPGWGPTGLGKLAHSLSKDNLQSLHRVSSTLNDVKKNGEMLMLTASQVTQVHRLKSSFTEASTRLADQASDWALIKRVDTMERKRPALRSGMRRSVSDNDFRSLRVPRVVTQAAQQLGSPESDNWDLLSALNSTLNQARAVNRPVFSLPKPGTLEEQVGGWGCYLLSCGTEVLGCLHCCMMLLRGGACHALEGCGGWFHTCVGAFHQREGAAYNLSPGSYN
jgi:hypothetical protein